jgi:hypothetical protein
MKKYKKHIVIVLFLAVANLLAFTRVHAQQLAKPDTWVKTWADTASHKSVAPELLADETTISYLKNDAKIECDNEEIAQKLLRRYDQVIKRVVWSYKKDRHGEYKHYVIVVGRQDADLIKSWAKSNL